MVTSGVLYRPYAGSRTGGTRSGRSIVFHTQEPADRRRGGRELAADTGDLSYLAEAGDALDRVGELLDYLSKLAREGRQVLDPDWVALREVTGTSWDAVGGADATLAVETDAVVMADRHQLRRLFENLFANALDHAGGGARFEVTGMGFENDRDATTE